MDNFNSLLNLSKFKLRFCLTNGTKFSDLSVLRTKIYDFKLVYFLGHPVCNTNHYTRTGKKKDGKGVGLTINFSAKAVTSREFYEKLKYVGISLW